jgi:hypothetical protein
MLDPRCFVRLSLSRLYDEVRPAASALPYIGLLFLLEHCRLRRKGPVAAGGLNDAISAIGPESCLANGVIPRSSYHATDDVI